MKRAIDKYVLHDVTVNTPSREYAVKVGKEQSLGELLDMIGTVLENTTEATSYVLVITHNAFAVEETV